MRLCTSRSRWLFWICIAKHQKLSEVKAALEKELTEVKTEVKAALESKTKAAHACPALTRRY